VGGLARDCKKEDLLSRETFDKIAEERELVFVRHDSLGSVAETPLEYVHVNGTELRFSHQNF
jgi:hypothetical protein